ncbi:MAG: ABC transporter permease [Planctomycetaceae bacterium]|nr:ABC transporter permease [Planctomycetaceae bacterium]
MNQSVWAVAKWEFFRFFKWRDQLIGVLSLLVTSAIGFGVVKFARSSNAVEVAVIGSHATLKLPVDSAIIIKSAQDSLEKLHAQLAEKRLDGILVITERENHEAELDVELIVRQQPSWVDELQEGLNDLKSRRSLAKSSILPEQLQSIFTPQALKITTTAPNSISLGDRVVAVGMGSLMILVCFIGLSFFMVGITSEKQQRITEQVVSVISPQAWIDGKLIGLTGAAFASVATLLVGGLIVGAVVRMAGYGFSIPDSLSRWDLLPLFAMLFMGGAVFWNCFFAAVSSIINDPNTSAKSGLLFLPMLPIAAGFMAIPQPDGMAIRVLSLLPGTSSTAMPIRLLLGEVVWWEIAICLLLLLLGIWSLRVAAGRIFAAGIMLYGKEPTWVEVLKWAMKS